MPKRSSRKLPIVSVLLAGLALGLAGIGRGGPASPQDPNNKPKADGSKDNQPTRYFFASTCAGCHEDAKGKQPVPNFVKHTEYTSWNGPDPHSKAFVNLQNDRGKGMMLSLGWKESDKVYEKCLACHAPGIADARLTDAKVPIDEVLKSKLLNDGVSCAACHGPNEKWVDEHAKREGEESWIRKEAKEKFETWGMNDLRDPATRTMICASCHVGDKEENRVVTHEMYAAGHPPLPGFEVSTFSDAEPPHWWSMKDVPYLKQTDRELMKNYGATQFEKNTKPLFDELRKRYRVGEFPTQNAKLVAVGGLVTFREAMDLFVGTSPTSPASPSDFARFDCAACHHDLRTWQDSFRQKREYKTDPGRPPAAEWPAAITRIAIYAGDESKIKTRLDQLEAGLASYRVAVGKAPFGDDQEAVKEARGLSDWTKDIIIELDANKLDAKSTLRMLKQIAKTEPPDYPSARQLAWSFKTVYTEMSPKPPNDKAIVATIESLIATLKVKFEAGEKDVLREVGARLDADDKFDPKVIGPLFKKLEELLP